MILEIIYTSFLLFGMQDVLDQKTIKCNETKKMDGHNVFITEGYETIKTYPFSDPNPLPSMAISKTVSSFDPYFMIDGYTDQAFYIDVLNKTVILPQEGARGGHEIFEMANIALALNNIEQKKHKKAVKYLEQAKQFPEKLGAGKLYDPYYRLQDYLLAY